MSGAGTTPDKGGSKDSGVRKGQSLGMTDSSAARRPKKGRVDPPTKVGTGNGKTKGTNQPKRGSGGIITLSDATIVGAVPMGSMEDLEKLARENEKAALSNSGGKLGRGMHARLTDAKQLSKTPVSSRAMVTVTPAVGKVDGKVDVGSGTGHSKRPKRSSVAAGLPDVSEKTTPKKRNKRRVELNPAATVLGDGYKPPILGGSRCEKSGMDALVDYARKQRLQRMKVTKQSAAVHGVGTEDIEEVSPECAAADDIESVEESAPDPTLTDLVLPEMEEEIEMEEKTRDEDDSKCILQPASDYKCTGCSSQMCGDCHPMGQEETVPPTDGMTISIINSSVNGSVVADAVIANAAVTSSVVSESIITESSVSNSLVRRRAETKSRSRRTSAESSGSVGSSVDDSTDFDVEMVGLNTSSLRRVFPATESFIHMHTQHLNMYGDGPAVILTDCRMPKPLVIEDAKDAICMMFGFDVESDDLSDEDRREIRRFRRDIRGLLMTKGLVLFKLSMCDEGWSEVSKRFKRFGPSKLPDHTKFGPATEIYKWTPDGVFGCVPRERLLQSRMPIAVLVLVRITRRELGDEAALKKWIRIYTGPANVGWRNVSEGLELSLYEQRTVDDLLENDPVSVGAKEYVLVRPVSCFYREPRIIQCTQCWQWGCEAALGRVAKARRATYCLRRCCKCGTAHLGKCLGWSLEFVRCAVCQCRHFSFDPYCVKRQEMQRRVRMNPDQVGAHRVTGMASIQSKETWMAFVRSSPSQRARRFTFYKGDRCDRPWTGELSRFTPQSCIDFPQRDHPTYLNMDQMSAALRVLTPSPPLNPSLAAMERQIKLDTFGRAKVRSLKESDIQLHPSRTASVDALARRSRAAERKRREEDGLRTPIEGKKKPGTGGVRVGYVSRASLTVRKQPIASSDDDDSTMAVDGGKSETTD